ncbi:amidohydrolase [Streptomyces sp. NA04227]|uniref:amidohydrolase n=1 Tax=Streptomyces sp. NA04227 TaxID=2742136 RepID=UPI001590905D|nr:amidohydrolase [Streptomyces sp. NA04227]QKW07199.1 amidohydrolase [Streptomyces sp. NA04227]
MNPRRLAPALVACLLATALSSCGEGGSGATVVVNAEVYTLDRDQPWAEAFAYDADGKITAVGSESDVRAKAGSGAKEIDARGNMVLPGFQDTHLHVPEAGINRDLCPMESGSTLAEYEDMAADCAAEQPDSEWVRAAGPSIFDLLDSDEPPIDVLDRAIPDRPALILDDLGHAVWTNSAGLKAAGIEADDRDPQGGIYGRDPETGRLNGLLLENAQQRIRNAAAPDGETVYKGLLVALDELAKNGVTSVSDAGGFWGQDHPAAWQRALKEDKLSVRAVNSLYLYPDVGMEKQLAEFERRFSDDPDSLLQFDTAKIYVDGILDLGTAWMLKPYDEPVNPEHPSGFPYFKRDQLRTYVSELHRIGYRMHFHVIGDAATRAALDAVEAIEADSGEVADRRHRTTHTYLVQPDDIERFAELGVIADFQVGPEAVDPAYHEQLSASIGDRAFDLIPVEKLLDADAQVSLSSDWDADPLSPFGIIERAVTRETNAVNDVGTAIRLVTADAAHALGQDDITGSIKVGKQADYVVVDQNLLEVPVDRVDETKVLLTVLAGHSTYQAAGFDR